MTSIQRGKAILHDAEMALQHLMTEAAQNGEYESLPTLAAWAQSVAMLVDEPNDSISRVKSAPSRKSQSASPRKSPKAKTKSAGYPRFVRDDDSLVKIGWSKREHAEYEHKASREAVKAVVASVYRLGRGGEQFTMDEVFPIEDLSGAEIPHYQCYLVLGWLRSVGLVTRHGRLGYTIADNTDLDEIIDDCWSRLALRASTTRGSK